jgi:major membrane immunogen (membrane-anchored lipoprotein)
MKKNVLVIVLLSTILLTGCGKKAETDTPTATEKQPYYISVTKGSELKSEYTLKKTGKLSSNSEIIVSALI